MGQTFNFLGKIGHIKPFILTFLSLILFQSAQGQYFFNEYNGADGFCPTETIANGSGYQILSEKIVENQISFSTIDINSNGDQTNIAEVTYSNDDNQKTFRLSDGNLLTIQLSGTSWIFNKVSYNGSNIWLETHNLTGNIGLGENIKNGPNGEIFFAGFHTANDAVYTLKLSADGQVLWNSEVVSPNVGLIDGAYVSSALSDGSVVVIGTASTGYSSTNQTRAVKLDSGTGNLIWDNYSNIYPFHGQIIESGNSNNVFAAFSYGRVNNFNTDSEFYSWSNSQGYYSGIEYNLFSSSNREFKTALEATADGGVLVGGYHVDNAMDGTLYHREMVLAKFDSNGDLLWLVNDYPFYGYIKVVTELSTGNILLSGTRGETPWAMVVNSEGLATNNPCATELPNYTFINEILGNYYFVSDNNLPYTQAQSQAASAGGHLVSIDYNVENSLVFGTANDLEESLYIGLNDLNNEGNPNWDSGDPITYTVDCPTCPMNSATNDVVSMPEYNSVWNWESGDAYRKSVLEVECTQNFEGIAGDLPANDGISNCLTTENLLSLREATMSSTSNPNGEPVAASKANDGLITGTSAVSQFENEPFWSARLYNQLDVEEIVIYPGPSGIGDFYLLTSIGYFYNNITLEDAMNNNFASSQFVSGSSTGPIVIPVNELVNTIRIQMVGEGVLDIAEVQAFGCSRYEDIHDAEYFECPDDILLTAGPNGTATPQWDPTVVTGNGCYYAGNGTSGYYGPQPGDALTPGEYLVEYYTYNDFCGNQYCRFNIIVLPNDGGNGNLTTTCPSDQTFTAIAGQNTTIPNWSLPTGTTTCSGGQVNIVQSAGPNAGTAFPVGSTAVSYSISDNCGNAETCSFNIIVEIEDISNCTENISGFTFLGSYNSHNYFISNNSENWSTAAATSASLGGYLASVNDANENEFIRSQLGNNMVFIGFNDAQLEGNFNWDSGENILYTNLSGSNSAAGDFAVMNFWAGSWTLDGAAVKRPYILEVECSDSNNGTLSVNCPGNQQAVGAPGATLVFTEWDEPTGTTTCPGGIVTVEQITDYQNSTSYVAGSYYDLIYEITDECGNSSTCEFRVNVTTLAVNFQLDCIDDITVSADGQSGAIVSWNESDIQIINDNCPGGTEILERNQTSGPSNGSLFPIGTYTINYQALVECSNPEDAYCSFTVTVTGGGDCPDNIPGFSTLGEFGNSKYYISDDLANWSTAQSIAVSNGGHLASFSSAEENQFVTGLISDLAFIGYNDADGDGVYNWSNGEAVGYNNSTNTPNDAFAYMNFWNGEWGFDGQWTQRRFIIELSCGGDPCICTTEYDPVCAGGMTFSNACEAECAGFTNYEDGSCIQLGGPDLTISDFCCLATTYNVGGIESFQFELSNIGDATALGDYLIGAYLSTDQNWSTDDLLVGEVITGNTPIGSIPNIDASINLQVEEGAYYLILVVDAFSEIDESNESNNTYVATNPFIVQDGDLNPCPDVVSGYTLLGSFGDSNYYISNSESTWLNAKNAANSAGGYLVSFNDATENAFVASLISEIVFIGLNDVSSEGDLVWEDGSTTGFSNLVGVNSDGNDFGNMNFWDGGWSFDGIWNQRKSILEIPCNGSGPALRLVPQGTAQELVQFANLFPNPASNDLFLQLETKVEQDINIQVLDINGKIIFQQTLSLTNGISSHQIDIRQLTGGVYCIMIPQGNGTYKTTRFIKGEL